MNLNDYVKTYDNWIDDTHCHHIINELKELNWQKHQFYDPLSDQYLSRSGEKELSICYNSSDLNSYIMQKIWYAYSQYIKDINVPWFQGWSGFTQVRYNKYEPGQLMAIHCDHITSIFDGERKGVPILTALGCLNDDYKGGDFVMWDKVIKLKQGSVIVFPSNFLFPHKVDEVIEGNRYTFVSWAW